MKRRAFLLPLLFLMFVTLLSCSKKEEQPTDPNQPYIDKMKSACDSVINNTPVPGLVALVVDNKKGIDWIYAAGVSDKVTGAPMDVNHTFRIASNTKTFTGTVLLQLVDEGKISLSDPLSKFFPEYPHSDSITVTMLANMSSGIFDYFDDEQWVNTIKNDPMHVWSPGEIVALAFSHPLLFTPGTQFKYTNTNTFLLGMIIEQVTGNLLETEITNRIIRPLGLLKTGFLPSGAGFPGPHGRGYDFGELGVTGDVTESYDISNTWAAGAVYSTPRELQKYIERLVEGGFLSDSLQDHRLNKDFQYMNPIRSYGLCLSKLETFYGHNGIVWGYVSSMYHSHERQCTVIIYYNLSQPATQLPDNLFGKFCRILYPAQ
ncbi:MAG: class A beta-lactamase-related serine hydrolase [Alphaproteobacteria bacterium]|nr:class A beta-lactamase-related serine hydrolase [Alphaproteobacteria bacterium]